MAIHINRKSGSIKTVTETQQHCWLKTRKHSHSKHTAEMLKTGPISINCSEIQSVHFIENQYILPLPPFSYFSLHSFHISLFFLPSPGGLASPHRLHILNGNLRIISILQKAHPLPALARLEVAPNTKCDIHRGEQREYPPQIGHRALA